MKTLRNFIVFICLICSQMIWAQISFQASVNKESIPLNDVIQIEFSLNADGDNFQPPRFDGFVIVGGPGQSVSQTWINGKRSMSKAFTYILQPKKKGKFTIGSATITIEDQVYRTQPVTITVTDAINRPDPRQRVNEAQQNALDRIHLVAELSKNNPYLNEPVTLTYKLYFNVGISGYRGKSFPTYDKFWTYSIEQPQQPQIKQGKYRGQDYHYVVIKQEVLMPQETGQLIIKPLSLIIQAEVPTGRRDFFGYPEYGYMENEYSTNKLAVNVRELPEQGRPTDFNGGVGQFTFQAVPSKKEVKAGEPITLTVSVAGKGNLNLATLPTPVAHSALEVYDPEYSEQLNPGMFGLQGKRTNKYTIIPQYKGTYAIEPMSFSYFDLESKTYKTIQTDTIKINVLDGPMLPTNKETKGTDTISNSEVFQKNAKKATVVEAYNSTYWKSTLFYVLSILPFIGIPLFVLVINQKRKLAGDVTGNRLRQNNKLARKFLSNAKKNLHDKALFYEALERCLHNFLKAKLNIETSEMSNENIEEILGQRNITEEAIGSFMSLKNACEWARYTPTEQVEMNKDYETAIQVISQLEKQFK
ncbi:MAG: BatD family protein [Flavobacteriaceae bacterium]|jgi:hypothetical protein|nr:BatD family protein [Flavobacteriaceae bacterium]